MFMDNPLKAAGKISVLGTPIDMSRTRVPAYVVAGITDHITPWQAVLSVEEHPAWQDRLRAFLEWPYPEHRESSDQSESQVLPHDSLPETPEDWLAGAREQPGSWWTHWATWYRGHGGGEVPAAETLGSAAHPAGDPAPGRYVHQR
jgi:polyhydroxyalkanoate synthase